MKYVALNLKAVVASRSAVGNLIRDPGDAVIIQREIPRWLILKCPCGCGEEIPINLDRRAGKAWRYYGNTGDGMTLFPSIWRDTGCGSHFVVWRGRILLFGTYEHNDDGATSVPRFLDLVERVRAAWPAVQLTSYVDVADKLGEIPWDILEVCRHLAHKGVLAEGNGPQRGMFRRK